MLPWEGGVGVVLPPISEKDTTPSARISAAGSLGREKTEELVKMFIADSIHTMNSY